MNNYSIKTELNHMELNDLIICAFRYALGRKTYITSTISDLIIKFKSKLDKHSKDLIIKEITEAINQNVAGMDIDVKSWLKCISELTDGDDD